MALAILAVSLGTLIGSVFWAMRLEEVNEETAAASQRLRALLERLHAMPIAEVYAAYNDDPSDDPDPRRDYRAELEVSDPSLWRGRKDAPVVRVSFPENEAGLDAAQSVLPVTVRLEWESASGARSVAITASLGGR